jgi:hypothetical protein
LTPVWAKAAPANNADRIQIAISKRMCRCRAVARSTGECYGVKWRQFSVFFYVPTSFIQINEFQLISPLKVTEQFISLEKKRGVYITL